MTIFPMAKTGQSGSVSRHWSLGHWAFVGHWCLVIAVLITPLRSSAAVPPASIDAALERAKAYLYSQQKDGNWEQDMGDIHGDQRTGMTALVVYSLLSMGESAQDPRLIPAIDYLKKSSTDGVYALGMRCQVWLMLPQTADVKRLMNRDAAVLHGMMIAQGDGKGFYPYNPGKAPWSLSRAQYAVLGIWAAVQTGFEVNTSYWQTVEKAWIDAQDAGGGWSYKVKDPQYPITPGITAVGVATLFITQDYLHAADSVTPRGNISSPNIEKGMKWMIDNFDKVATNQAFSRDYPYATLYAVERIGVASGRKYFGSIDWYDKGAAWLMTKQQRDGAWPRDDHGFVANTSFAILFLSRGRAPLGMNKLDYTMSGTRRPALWNQRSRDVANATRWVGRQLEKDLNWQIVNLSAPVEEWHDAPILYISGSEPIVLDAAGKAKIKQFIESGGLVLGNADGANQNFVTSFRNLGQELFKEYEFRPLPADHVIYTRQQFKREQWRTKPPVLGLSNGVRELMLIAPQTDIAQWWQRLVVAGREEYWQLASNIFLYSVDSKVFSKRGESYLVPRDAGIAATSSAKVARIKFTGNWDPEPGGWRRLSNVLHNRARIDVETVVIDPSKEALDGFKLAHLTGTEAIKLDPAARAKLKAFVDSGGTLVIDAAGGSSAFATAAEQEIDAMFGNGKLTNLMKDHPLFNSGTTAMASFGYRDYASTILGAMRNEPRLRAIEVNGRPGVIYSREDLSAGLVGQAVNGIIGYDPTTANEIMSRIVLFTAGK